MDPYFAIKFLHVLSSTILFGKGIGTAFQMVFVMQRSKPNVTAVASTASGVVMADWIFTTPAGIIQPTTGAILIYWGGYSMSEGWLLLTYGLYVVAFLCWLPVVHIQIKIRDLAKRAIVHNADIPVEAKRLYRIWFLLGWPAFISLVIIYWLMLTKPEIPFLDS